MARQYVAWGAGPRAGQFMVLGAKALAAMEGQPTPGCDHVRRVAMAVLRHRVVINYAATGDDITAEHIVRDLLDQVSEPAYTG